MGNGYICFRLASGTFYKFKTNRPWEELQLFQATTGVTKEGCIVIQDLGAAPVGPADLDTGKTELNILRDAYTHSVRKNKMDAWCPWPWSFTNDEVWLPPKDADTLSMMWKDIWHSGLTEASDNYPVPEAHVKRWIKDVQEVLDYASTHGHYVHITHYNGY